MQALRSLLEARPEPRLISEPPPISEPPRKSAGVAAIAASYGSAFLVLLVAQYTIVWLLDLDRMWLLAATILVPYLAALATKAVRRVAIPILDVVSLVFGIVCVGAMSLVAAWGDVSMALPNGRLEWINDIGWVLSVALSYITGALTPRAVAAASKLLIGNLALKAEAPMVRMGHLIEVATPIVTATGAVATGVNSLLK